MKLINGDCLVEMKNIQDKSVDMILCDLPYGTTACKWDIVIPFEPLWESYKRLIKPKGAIVLFGSQPFTTTLIASNIKNFKYEWIWKKNEGSGFATSKYRPIKYHENICVFSYETSNYYPQKTKRESIQSINRYKTPVGIGRSKRAHGTLKNVGNVQYDNEWKNPESVLNIKCVPNGGGKKIHPTQKPVALFEYLIKTYTNKGETVLDNCMGSGTTGVACKNLNREFIGIEKDENYFNIAKQRI